MDTTHDTQVDQDRLRETEDLPFNMFGETLRLYRERALFTILELAQRAKVERWYIRKLEEQPNDWLNTPADDTPYKPERDLVIRLALALQLKMEEADDLLTVAGYAPLRRPDPVAALKVLEQHQPPAGS